MSTATKLVWLFEQPLFGFDENSTSLRNTVIEGKGNLKDVTVAPFTDTIEPEPEKIPNVVYFPYGSNQFTQRMFDRGHRMCFNKQFNTEIFCREHPKMLNKDAVVIQLSELTNFISRKGRRDTDSFFVRPTLDLKSFVGKVYTAQELLNWSTNHCFGSELDKNICISIAKPKNLGFETRWFIVGGEVITGSNYRFSGKLSVQSQDDKHSIERAQKVADIWLPHDNCVMDTTEMHDTMPHVIEFNCIHSAGFYACNVQKIYDAITKHYC